MQLNPREAIINALIESGFSLINHHHFIVDIIKGTRSHTYTLQKEEGEKAVEFHFRGDVFRFSVTLDEYSDFLLAKRVCLEKIATDSRTACGYVDPRLNSMVFGKERVSSCCTASAYAVFDTETDEYYHVEHVIGHPTRASVLPSTDAPKELVEEVKEHYALCA